MDFGLKDKPSASRIRKNPFYDDIIKLAAFERYRANYA